MTGAISGAVTGGIAANHCFVAGTPILMEDGYKAIETVKAGDKVYAANEETGEVSVKEVVRTFVNETNELVHLQIGDNELITTRGHPFFIYGKGFEYAGNLRAGDILVNVNGEKVVLELVQHEILEAPVKVYNFEVEDWHTYFAGENEIWVHNMCEVDPHAGKISNKPGPKPQGTGAFFILAFYIIIQITYSFSLQFYFIFQIKNFFISRTFCSFWQIFFGI